MEIKELQTCGTAVLSQVIGMSGIKQSGKDTLGNYFVEKYGYKRLAFADALKEACREIFGFSEEQLYGDKKEVIDGYWGVTPRTVFQYIGTDLFREQIGTIMPNVGKNIWLKVIEKKILDEWKQNPNTKFVITDVRFSNECEMVKNLGGTVIRVKRDSCSNIIDHHCSELEIDNLNVTIEVPNNGTKEELFNLTIKFLAMNMV